MAGEKPEDYIFDPGMAHYREIETALEKVATTEHAEYVPVSSLLCNQSGCKADIDDTVLYFDHGHLSVAGAKLVAAQLLAPILWPPAAMVQGPSELQNQVAQ
jgi:hypothetical protein